MRGPVRTISFGIVSAALLLGCAGGQVQTTKSNPPQSENSASVQPSPPQTAVSQATETPTAVAIRQGNSFKTSGTLANWKAFTWTKLPADSPLRKIDPTVGALQLVAWAGGYGLCGSTNGGDDSALWTSTDGTTWVQVMGLEHPTLVASGTAGLLVVARHGSVQSIWTSSDGTHWRAAGSPDGLSIDSIAGTATGYVAVGHGPDGSGQSNGTDFIVSFSPDGRRWTPVHVQDGVAWDEVGPRVQSGNGRFFLMGGYWSGLTGAGDVLASVQRVRPDGDGFLASGAAGTGGLWWSDDGRTWTRSDFGGYFPNELEVGSNGLLLWSSSRLIPGNGPELARSIDGGKTWAAEPTYGPIGSTPTSGTGEAAGIASPDGVIATNGSTLLAVKSNGRSWVSADAHHWTTIPWKGPVPNGWSLPIWMLPRGVIVGDSYGAAY